MEQPGLQKICFDLEDRPPLSYWEQQHAKSSSDIATPPPGAQKVPKFKPEEWVKAPEFVPRSRQLLSDSFYLDPFYNETTSQVYDSSYPYSYGGESEAGVCHPVLATYMNQPQFDYSLCMPNEATVQNAPKKKKRRRQRKAKDAAVEHAQDVVNEVPNSADIQEEAKRETESKGASNSGRQQSAFSESAENISLDYSEDSAPKNQRLGNQRSFDEDFSLMAIGGSCPELFDMQVRNSSEKDDKWDCTSFQGKNSQDQIPGRTQGSSLLYAKKPLDSARQSRSTALHPSYKPPTSARMQMATFNPEYNTISSSLFDKHNKDGFIQDCFEGLNVRVNNFDEGEELTLSDTEEVSPPRLKQLPWILENNFSQYRKLNAPERVCCSVM